ncbi:MAG TPA: FecR domain-containing protein [Thermoanaerobaculia bacterium]|nr:FecR domain-containing protein [Thermoanaerobaculia bacterium]
MSQHTRYDDQPIDRACDEIRGEAAGLDARREEAALERAWEGIRRAAAAAGPGTVLNCSDIQALLPAYLEGRLEGERSLLVEDHSRSCIACRRELRRLRLGAHQRLAGGTVERSRSRWKWGLAAAALLALGLTQAWVVWRYWPSGDGAGAMMRVVEGALFTVSSDSAGSFSAGAEIPYGQEVVTPRGSGAVVQLHDGSRVELRERSRFAVTRNRAGTTIDLEGGNLVVEAADQRDGKLYVDTGEVVVSVEGTVFSVNAGTKGSRVSVFEGEVHVDQRGRRLAVLRPGDQVTSNPALATVPLAEEVAWSPNQERYLALLRAVVALEDELRSVPLPGLRYGSDLLASMPRGTVLYVTLPNLSGSLQESLARVEERVAENALLAEWWQSEEALGRLQEVLARLAVLGETLGEEVVLAGWLDGSDELVGPVAVAQVLDPAGFRLRLDEQLAELAGEWGEGATIHVVSDPAAASGGGEGLWIWPGDEHVVAAIDAAPLQAMGAALASGGAGFADEPFHATLASRYQDGVDTLIAVDLGSWVLSGKSADEMARLERLGVADVEHLVIEQWVDGDTTRRHAVLSFTEARRGIASWLAAPAPMGSLGFVGPDAATAAAFVFKEPAALFADLMGALTAEEREDVLVDLAEFEREQGIDLQADLFTNLGGEIAFALDGPLAPEPAWKVVVEVYDPVRLQIGLEQLFAQLDAKVRDLGEGTVVVSEESLPAGTAWRVRREKPDGMPFEAWYTFADGYLVATPSAALLDRALRYRASEHNLLHSSRLRAMLPADAQVNLSALWYQDFSAVAQPLAEILGSGALAEGLPEEMRAAMQGLSEGFGPSLAYAYGEDDRILLATSSSYDPLGLVKLLLLKGMAGG